MSAWQRATSGRWSRVLGPVAAHVGRDGIGQASESTSRTPTGTFPISQAFGRQPPPGTAVPYIHVGPHDWWVSDVSSPLYNTHQVCAPTTCPFNEGVSENLEASGPAYDYAAVIDYNTSPARPGAGSAYFLHLGAGPTAGCVATDRATVLAVLRWLDPHRKPLITLGIG